MTYGQVLVETYLEDIDELKSELDELTYYPGYDGEIVEKYVTCPRPNLSLIHISVIRFVHGQRSRAT